MKEELKKEAVSLRRKGYSIKQIAERFGIARSTVSLWLRKIKLSKVAKAKIQKRSDEARAKGCATNRNKRLARLSAIDKKAIEEIKKIDLSESSNKLLCAMIYYCEGAKDDGAVYFLILIRIY